MLKPDAEKQSPGRWLARVLRLGGPPPYEIAWRGDRIHRTARAAKHEAGDRVREMEKAIDMRNLPVRACSIVCKAHPEWGSFGVYEDRGDYYEIRGERGGRVLDKSEAAEHWELAP